MKWLLFILFALPAIQASSRVIRVGKDNSIRKAIDQAINGDTILVERGVYREGSIRITKSITLLGEGLPEIDGEMKFEPFVVSGDRIRISGFLIRNSGKSVMNDYAAIKVIDATNVIIDNNRIIHAYFAIHFANSSRCTVQKNMVEGLPGSEQNTGNGIHMWKCNNMLVDGNKISGHRDGIYFEFVSESLISNNSSNNNVRYGLHFMFSHNDTYENNTFKGNGAGVAVMYSKKVKMEKNHFNENWGASAYGILLKDITDSEIFNNEFRKNTVGIHMEGSSRIKITGNSFRDNGWAIKVQASCDDNTFSTNNFQGNTFDVSTNGTMVLNRFTSNYWDKYDGYDINRDGTGDIPYHPVSMYSMIVEQNPTTIILLRSFMVSLLDKAEKAIPSLTPENLRDNEPRMKPIKR